MRRQRSHEDVAVVKFRELEDIIAQVQNDVLLQEVLALAVQVEAHEPAFGMRSRSRARQDHAVLIWRKDHVKQLLRDLDLRADIAIQPDEPVELSRLNMLQSVLDGEDLVREPDQILPVVIVCGHRVHATVRVPLHERDEIFVLIEHYVCHDELLHFRREVPGCGLDPVLAVQSVSFAGPRGNHDNFLLIHVTSFALQKYGLWRFRQPVRSPCAEDPRWSLAEAAPQ